MLINQIFDKQLLLRDIIWLIDWLLFNIKWGIFSAAFITGTNLQTIHQVSEWLLFNAKWTIFSALSWQEQNISDEMMTLSALY